MPTYHYVARDQRGVQLQGHMQARSSDAVARQLMGNQLVPVEITFVQESTSAVQVIERWLQRAPKLEDLILFSQQMHTLMRAGVPILQAIQSLSESTHHHGMSEALAEIADDLESGMELSSALQRHKHIFPTLFTSMIQVGENTGRLDEAFLRLSEYLSLEKETREQINAAMRYPMIVVVAIFIAITVISLMVIPAFATLFEQSRVELPLQTRIIIAVSNFAVAYWMYILAALVAAVFGFTRWIKTTRGRYLWDKYKLRIPIVGSIIRRAILGRFARAFSMALASGVPMLEALQSVALALDNRYMQGYIEQMRNDIERGETATQAATQTGLFTPMILQMLAVGEESGAIDDLLTEVALFYEREVSYDIKRINVLIEPLLLLGIGIMVLILALGVFLPMWNLMELYRR